MQYCPSCGNEVSDSASFCPDCGQNLDSEGNERGESVTASDSLESGETPQTADQTQGEGVGEGGSEQDVVHGLKAVSSSIIPTLAAMILVGLVGLGTSSVWLFGFLAFGGFTYVFYQQPSGRAMASSAFFWLAIEVFLWPIAQTVNIVNSPTVGGGIAEILGIFMVAMVAALIGTVLYLISRRLSSTSEE